LSRFERIRIVLPADCGNSEDDELCYAYYAANAPADAIYRPRRICDGLYDSSIPVLPACAFGRRVGMVLKCVASGRTRSWHGVAKRAVWWAVNRRLQSAVEDGGLICCHIKSSGDVAGHGIVTDALAVRHGFAIELAQRKRVLSPQGGGKALARWRPRFQWITRPKPTMKVESIDRGRISERGSAIRSSGRRTVDLPPTRMGCPIRSTGREL